MTPSDYTEIRQEVERVLSGKEVRPVYVVGLCSIILRLMDDLESKRGNRPAFGNALRAGPPPPRPPDRSR